MIDTPVSALPSRFMTNEFLPSPSSFYPEWNFSGRESNTLPSPLNFATPVVGTGPSFLREDSGERAGERQGSQGGQAALNKRKTPEPDEGGDSKRVKHEG
jgi:MADS-box transcription factor